jgi:hypothetical protein
MKAASAVSEGVFGHKLTQSEKKIAGTAVHYLLGTAVDSLYGAAAEIAPNVTTGGGLPFGAVFWLVVDEGGVPCSVSQKDQRHIHSPSTLTLSHHTLFMNLQRRYCAAPFAAHSRL